MICEMEKQIMSLMMSCNTTLTVPKGTYSFTLKKKIKNSKLYEKVKETKNIGKIF